MWRANPDDRTAELARGTSQRRVRNQEYRFRMKDGRELTGLLSAELTEIDGAPCGHWLQAFRPASPNRLRSQNW
jgi:hypothetical protein